MLEIVPPRKIGGYNGRLRDCRRALEPAIRELLSAETPEEERALAPLICPAARAAGWGEIEVVVAVSMIMKQPPT